MVKLCIFDLDGTILDTVKSIAHYGNMALKKHGIEPIPTEEYRYLAGDGATTLIHRMLARRGCDGEALHQRVFRDYNEAYNADTTYLTSIFEGLLEALDRIREQKIPMVILSNKPDFAARTVTTALFGEGYFESIVGQREGIPLKPDPTGALALAKAYGAAPSECLYVGDTSTDMQTGKRAGMLTVGVLWGFREETELLKNGADLIASTPEELCEFVTRY